MGCKFHPVVLYHALQGVVAAQGRQAALAGDGLDVAAYDVLQPVLLEGAVLVPDHLELAVDLPQEEAALDHLEGEVVEPEQPEVAPHEERVLIGRQLPPGELGEEPPADLDGDSGYIEREQVDDLVDGLRASHEIAAAQVLQDLDELIGGEAAVVEVHVEIVDDLEEVLLEELLARELEGLDLELAAHDLGEPVDEEAVAVVLDLLVVLDALVLGRVEEVEGRHGVGVQPEDDGQRQLREGHHQDHRVGNELDHVDLDAVAFRQLVPRELVVHLGLVEVEDPLGVVPEVFGALDERVLGLLEDELGLEQQRLLAVREQLLLQLLHLVVVQHAVLAAVQQPPRPRLQGVRQHPIFIINLAESNDHGSQKTHNSSDSAGLSIKPSSFLTLSLRQR